MIFALLFVLVLWISVIPFPTRALDGGRELSFPAYYFFAEKRLVNHTIISVPVKDLDECEYRCYLIANCVSLNIKNKDPTSGTHDCELNNSTHLEDDGDLEDNQLYYYRGAENHCGKNQKKCQNNATCLSGFTSKKYRCLCNPGFEGEHCEHDIDDCVSNACKNGGSCVDGINGYTCKCKDGFTGKNCQTDIDDCVSNACKNGGSCVDAINGYTCKCKDGFMGEQCQTVDHVCRGYKVLNTMDRKDTYTVSGSYLCDNALTEAWYRFQGNAGTRMPTTCVARDKCGTDFPGWLNGDHPTVAEGEVTRQVCFHECNSCNQCTKNIKVKNCTSYYVYKLDGTSGCDKRYCGTD